VNDLPNRSTELVNMIGQKVEAMRKASARDRRKTIVTVTIMVPIALLHFVTGSQYDGPFPIFVNGYLIDILLPFGFYFLLSLSENDILQSWKARGLLIFMAASAVELAQYNGIPLLGRTFDPVDIIMYGLGVFLAILCDLYIFPQVFSFWKPRLKYPRSEAEEKDSIFIWRQN
jgi:hypothetical protein